MACRRSWRVESNNDAADDSTSGERRLDCWHNTGIIRHGITGPAPADIAGMSNMALKAIDIADYEGNDSSSPTGRR